MLFATELWLAAYQLNHSPIQLAIQQAIALIISIQLRVTYGLRDNLVGNNPGKNFGKLQGAQDRRTTKDKKRKFPRIIETDTPN